MTNLKNSLQSEAHEQCKLIKWADECVQMKIHPELSMLYAVPNGGRRDKAEAAHFKMQGGKSRCPRLVFGCTKRQISRIIH